MKRNGKGNSSTSRVAEESDDEDDEVVMDVLDEESSFSSVSSLSTSSYSYRASSTKRARAPYMPSSALTIRLPQSALRFLWTANLPGDTEPPSVLRIPTTLVAQALREYAALTLRLPNPYYANPRTGSRSAITLRTRIYTRIILIYS